MCWGLGCSSLFAGAGPLAVGRAFEPVNNSGVNVPRYASFGIWLRGIIQFLLSVPRSLSSSIVFSGRPCWSSLWGWPVATGALLGLKVAGLLLASRFISISLSFSSGTNDTSRVRFRSLLMFAILVAGGLGFMILAAASLFVPQHYVAWAFWGLAAVDAYGMFLVYRWFYHTNCFDLISLPRQ
jgi:hypothetical protein